jgi:Tol biopolymer transport system component
MKIKNPYILISIITFALFQFSCIKQETKWQTNGLITYYSIQNGNYNIFVMKPDGTRKIQLTNGKAKNICGIWSPDGNKMIFSSERHGNSEIYIMDAYGNNQKRLTNNNTRDYHHRWSPNSQHIVYVSNEDGNQEIYIMNVDGSNKTNISNSEINEMFPCWSPDGESILYCSEENEGWKIYRMDINGENREKVSEYTGTNWELYPQYSPDGKKITYFTHEPEKQIRNIFVMNKNGKNIVQLTHSDFVDEDPFWSPDSKYIIFQSNRTGNYQIYTMKADGTEQTSLSNNKHSEYWPSWSWIQEH